jgi:DNA-directed RNA polymerase subunit RPC12/RpoP
MTITSIKSGKVFSSSIIIPRILRRYITMADKNIVCKDCGKDFVFTEGEQAFYKEKGFENDPVRCPECRRARKADRNGREKRF